MTSEYNHVNTTDPCARLLDFFSSIPYHRYFVKFDNRLGEAIYLPEFPLPNLVTRNVTKYGRGGADELTRAPFIAT